MGCHSLLQGIYLTQGSNPGLSHCRRILSLYHLSHQEAQVLDICQYQWSCSVVSALWDLMDSRGPIRLFVHEIFQARILECVAISFSRESSWPKDQTQVSCIIGRCFYPLSHRLPYNLTLDFMMNIYMFWINQKLKIIKKIY